MRGLLLAFLVGSCGRIGFDDVTRGDATIGNDVALPANTNIAFVTSTTVVPGMLGSLAAADQFCNDRATAGGLPGTYVAWLSTTTVNARDRIAASRGWVQPDGRPFTDSPANLVLGAIYYPLQSNEFGARVPEGTLVATMTAADGTFIQDDCAGFTSTLDAVIQVGNARMTSTVWTAYSLPLGCATPWRLYCFGIGHVTPVSPPPVTGRRAWLSSWIPGTGIAAADAACSNDASTAGFIGTFRALLASNGASAISRFNIERGAWSRVDGAVLATSAQAFAAGDVLTSLNVTASGAYNATLLQVVWTGGRPSEDGTNTTTCETWTVAGPSMTGVPGYALSSGSDAFDQGQLFACGTGNGLYCLED